MRGCTLPFVPFSDFDIDSSKINEPIKMKPGLEYFMIELTANKLNFTYDIIPASGGLWGLQTPDVSYKVQKKYNFLF